MIKIIAIYVGEKIGFLGNRKLEDGNLCKDCARKLSPFFTERRSSTVEEIRTQLAYREENAKKLADFHPDLIFGTDEKVYLDLTAKQLIVTGAEDFREDNPDIIDASQIKSCETEIEDNEEELFFTDKEGNEKSYNPPRYQYAYEFHITLKIDSPWFEEISVDLNNELVAMIPDAVTFANQITKVEAYRPEKGFCDGVKGLCLSGAKVTMPDAVFIYNLSA